ncbi:MAG TPA: nickel pincer cofactor biosynthesis protein LarC [Patescibacteria group bacterium]|nr:nickel pincer cofactor biosynthesis protein LarC [Patescibacteria group bacterium]
MTLAYFDCFAGISGDMALGALLDAGADRSLLDATVEALRLGDEVTLDVRHETRGHAGGTRVVVGVSSAVERTVPALRALVEEADAPERVRTLALDAIDRLANAEGRIHGVDRKDLHLHELGGADTLVDLLGAFWLMHGLGVERVFSSPLPAPRGRRDGMPIPAPASLRVLEGTGAVLHPVDGEHELVTPTGAAILAACAEFGRPSVSLRAVGYGVGARTTPGNVLAVWIGDDAEAEAAITVIETNLDDMAPNLIAALCEDLMEAGALDVSVTPALMKKGRPGHLLRVMSAPELSPRLSEHLLRHSTTLGVRLTPAQRVTAQRRILEIQTPFGPARVKVKELGGRSIDVAAEYEDCRRISRETGTNLREVMRVVTDSARRALGLN